MKTRSPLAALAWLALACATPLPVEPPLPVSPLSLGADAWRVTDQVVILTDASGTMYARRTFPLAKALTRTFVAAMPAGDVRSARPGPYQAGLLAFGGSDRIAAPLAPFDRAALARTADDLHILGDVDGMGGATPYRHVLPEIGQQLAGRSGRAAVVVFSDGLPDFPERALTEAAVLAESYPGELCYHVVQTGSDPLGAEFLRELAGLTPCGSRRSAASVRDPAAFMALVRDVFAGPADAAATGSVGGDACRDVTRLHGLRFDFDRAEIRPDGAVVLDAAIDRLRQCPEVAVRVEGHTCAMGPDAYNQALSERRAGAVVRYMTGHGIDPSRLSTRGLGESDPVAPNDSREGRARNRRVELHPSR